MKLDAYWSVQGNVVILAGRGVLILLTKKQAAQLAKKLAMPPRRQAR